MLKRVVYSFITIGMLVGCAVAWGKAYKIEFESSSSVTIN